MLERTIASHWGFTPDLMEKIVSNEIEAYNLPFGVMDHMLRDTAAGKPGTITHVGLGTFVDPRQDGAKANDITEDDIVELVTFDGEEYLYYRSVPIDVAIIRGTTADEDGNITTEREALDSNTLAMAQAAHNSGGTVIAQVERITESGTLTARDVTVPGVLVDTVVEAPPSHHQQTYAEDYNPAYSGEIKRPTDDGSDGIPLDVRTIIARRAAMELEPNSVINLGVGVPELVPVVAAEGGIDDEITQTVESGPVGGAASAGSASGPRATITRSYPRHNSSISTTAAVSTWAFWEWHRRTPRATSTSAGSGHSSPVVAGSSTSPRTPRKSCSVAR